jgi:hypothetical protein
MFAIVRLVGFLEDSGSPALPSSHPLSTVSALPRYTVWAPSEIDRSSRTARGFARRWGLYPTRCFKLSATA